MPSAGTVRKVAVPATARRLGTLGRIDYEDAFVVNTGPTGGRTAEGWARAFLEGAPAPVRAGLLSGWSALGLRVGSEGPGTVLGWEVRRSTPDAVLLGAGSRVGMPAELLFQRRARTLLFATFVRHDNALARAVWPGVVPLHEQVVRQLLARGAQVTPSGS
jgi:hypothetical protein